MRRKIRKIRRASGLSMRQFATRLGVRHATVCDWENGKAVPNDKNKERLLLFSKSKA